MVRACLAGCDKAVVRRALAQVTTKRRGRHKVATSRVAWVWSGRGRVTHATPSTHTARRQTIACCTTRAHRRALLRGAHVGHMHGFTYVDLSARRRQGRRRGSWSPVKGRMEVHAGWRHEPHEAEKARNT